MMEIERIAKGRSCRAKAAMEIADLVNRSKDFGWA